MGYLNSYTYGNGKDKRLFASNEVTTMVTTAEAQTIKLRIVRKVKTDPTLTFTVEMRYRSDDNGYSAECLELRGIRLGRHLERSGGKLAGCHPTDFRDAGGRPSAVGSFA